MKKGIARAVVWMALTALLLSTGCGNLDMGVPEAAATESAVTESVATEESPAKEDTVADSEATDSEESQTKEEAEAASEAADPEESLAAEEPEVAASEESSAASKASDSEKDAEAASSEESPAALDPDGTYTSCEDVALYLETYGKLPGNFITKKEAKALGWEGGSLEPYAPGKCIGGDKFGNYEGTLPEAKGRVYRECDIDTLGQKSRGAKRIVYSSDGLIYYTEDHYESFTLLYD